MSRDRFEAIVEKIASDGWSGDAWAVGADQVVTLLRREHAAIVRAVKRLQVTKGYSKDSLCQPAYQLACDDVLALLATRKGRKG